MKFGDRIKTLRKAKGYSQKELGDILELGQTTIANYEKNIRFPSPEILIQIANIFDESIDHLVGRIDSSKLEPFTKDRLNSLYENIFDMLLEENEEKVMETINGLELNNDRIIQLYEEVYKPVLQNIGQMWSDGYMTVAKEHYISGIVYKLITRNFMSPSKYTLAGVQASKGNVICMALSSELHILGIQMISDYFVMLGYKAYNIGSNVPTDALVDLINATKPLVLAISTTMPYHIDSLSNLIRVIRGSTEIIGDLANKLIIVVGGQAFKGREEGLSTGADYYANCFEELEELF